MTRLSSVRPSVTDALGLTYLIGKLFTRIPNWPCVLNLGL